MVEVWPRLLLNWVRSEYAVAEGRLGGAIDEGGRVLVGHGLVVNAHLRETEVEV